MRSLRVLNLLRMSLTCALPDYDAALDAGAARAAAMADRAAFDAALDAYRAAAAAIVTVRRRLDDIGVIGPAATLNTA